MKNSSFAARGMMLFALLFLCSCGGKPSDSAVSQPPIQEQTAQSADGAFGEAELPPDWKSYEDWQFAQQPYLLAGKAYESMFSGGDTVSMDACPNVEPWFGVPLLFPFVGFEEIGIVEGASAKRGGDVFCDEAWAIAQQFYTAAVEYSAPDGTQYVMQESNYPQFAYEPFAGPVGYRWFWNDPDSGDTPPSQPAAYVAPIQLQTAVMNDNAAGWFSHGADRDEERYAQLSLTEQTALQNQWMTDEISGWNIPEEERYYAITGLAILNGDSRTEQSYYGGSRAKNIRITINGEDVREVCLADSPAPQLISLAYRQAGISTPVSIRIEVLDTYAGHSDAAYISEIGVGITSNLDQGR